MKITNDNRTQVKSSNCLLGSKAGVVAFLTLSILSGVTTSQAALLVTRAEDSNAYVTSVQSTQVLTFDTLPAGGWSGTQNNNLTWTNGAMTIGTIDKVNVFTSDVWGGAGPSGSNYAAQYKEATTTLTLSTPNAYFGMWWSAGDNFNRLTFYHGSTLIAEFTTSSLLSTLPSEYLGSPGGLGNPNQAYAFINFFGMSGTSWDKIVFSNTSTASNFESDNWTTRVQSWGQLPGEGPIPPGTPVLEILTPTVIPEPSSVLAAMTSLVCFLMRRRR